MAWSGAGATHWEAGRSASRSMESPSRSDGDGGRWPPAGDDDGGLPVPVPAEKVSLGHGHVVIVIGAQSPREKEERDKVSRPRGGVYEAGTGGKTRQRGEGEERREGELSSLATRGKKNNGKGEEERAGWQVLGWEAGTAQEPLAGRGTKGGKETRLKYSGQPAGGREGERDPTRRFCMQCRRGGGSSSRLAPPLCGLSFLPRSLPAQLCEPGRVVRGGRCVWLLGLRALLLVRSSRETVWEMGGQRPAALAAAAERGAGLSLRPARAAAGTAISVRLALTGSSFRGGGVRPPLRGPKLRFELLGAAVERGLRMRWLSGRRRGSRGSRARACLSVRSTPY